MSAVQARKRVLELEAELSEAWQTCKEHREAREMLAARAVKMRYALELVFAERCGRPKKCGCAHPCVHVSQAIEEAIEMAGGSE